MFICLQDAVLMNADSIVSTSPSIYIEFLIVSAADLCGSVGSVHTSVILSLPPDQLSSCVYLNLNSELGEFRPTCQPFNFKDALCDPQSLASLDFWTMIGSKGIYNPLLSPPVEFAQLDQAWFTCRAARFQAKDPPIALSPQPIFFPI